MPALEKFQEFANALDIIDDDDMRFEYIIDIGKKLKDEDFPQALRTPQNIMHGCMSQVWLLNQPKDGKNYFIGFSDAIIVKGLVSMMIKSFSGLTADELDALTVEHVQRLNLGALTTQRQIGMMAMLEHFKKLGHIAQNIRDNKETH